MLTSKIRSTQLDICLRYYKPANKLGFNDTRCSNHPTLPVPVLVRFLRSRKRCREPRIVIDVSLRGYDFDRGQLDSKIPIPLTPQSTAWITFHLRSSDWSFGPFRRARILPFKFSSGSLPTSKNSRYKLSVNRGQKQVSALSLSFSYVGSIITIISKRNGCILETSYQLIIPGHTATAQLILTVKRNDEALRDYWIISI